MLARAGFLLRSATRPPLLSSNCLSALPSLCVARRSKPKSLLKISLAVVLACGVAAAQESLMDGTELVSPSSSLTTTGARPTAPQPTGTGNQPMGMGKMKLLIKQQVNKVIDGSYPSVTEWQPLTKREKFNVFLRSTYSPWTFANAAVDQMTDHVKGRQLSQEYETGFRGQAHCFFNATATTETDV